MTDTLSKYLPENAVSVVIALMKFQKVQLKIVNERMTRHGDYCQLSDGSYRITINASLNPYRFLLTLIHEMAHFSAFKIYGRTIKPHGNEWKAEFRRLMLPFLNPQVFPDALLTHLASHFRNPKASSDTDTHLAIALQANDPRGNKSYIFELDAGTVFRIYNGKTYRRSAKRVKRYECIEMSTGRIYLFQPNVRVEVISE